MVQQSRDADGSVSVTHSEDSSQMSSSFSARNLTVLFISLLLDLVAFTVILPLLPSLLDYYGSHDSEVPDVMLWLVMCVSLHVHCKRAVNSGTHLLFMSHCISTKLFKVQSVWYEVLFKADVSIL